MLSARRSRLQLTFPPTPLSYKAVMDSSSREVMYFMEVELCGVSSGIIIIYLIAHGKKWGALKTVRMPPMWME